jgi:predicted small metal-binding protein
MTLELRCGDVVDGCDGVVTAESQEAVLRLAAVHAAEAHGLTEIDASTRSALQAATHPA